MTPDQIRAHLALHGWEAWHDATAGDLGLNNLTHPHHGTVWLGGSGQAYYKHIYRYGLHGRDDAEISMSIIPDRGICTMWAKIQAVCYGS